MSSVDSHFIFADLKSDDNFFIERESKNFFKDLLYKLNTLSAQIFFQFPLIPF